VFSPGGRWPRRRRVTFKFKAQRSSSSSPLSPRSRSSRWRSTPWRILSAPPHRRSSRSQTTASVKDGMPPGDARDRGNPGRREDDPCIRGPAWGDRSSSPVPSWAPSGPEKINGARPITQRSREVILFAGFFDYRIQTVAGVTAAVIAGDQKSGKRGGAAGFGEPGVTRIPAVTDVSLYGWVAYAGDRDLEAPAGLTAWSKTATTLVSKDF